MTPTTNYDVDYFIEKFTAIPEEKWITYDYGDDPDGPHCAYGHCGMTSLSDDYTAEAQALYEMFAFTFYPVTEINDGFKDRYNQPTPKQRILAALHDIKNGKI